MDWMMRILICSLQILTCSLQMNQVNLILKISHLYSGFAAAFVVVAASAVAYASDF